MILATVRKPPMLLPTPGGSAWAGQAARGNQANQGPSGRRRRPPLLCGGIVSLSPGGVKLKFAAPDSGENPPRRTSLHAEPHRLVLQQVAIGQGINRVRIERAKRV